MELKSGKNKNSEQLAARLVFLLYLAVHAKTLCSKRRIPAPLLLLEDLRQQQTKNLLHIYVLFRTHLDVRRLVRLRRPLAILVVYLPLLLQVTLQPHKDHWLVLQATLFLPVEHLQQHAGLLGNAEKRLLTRDVIANEERVLIANEVRVHKVVPYVLHQKRNLPVAPAVLVQHVHHLRVSVHQGRVVRVRIRLAVHKARHQASLPHLGVTQQANFILVFEFVLRQGLNLVFAVRVENLISGDVGKLVLAHLARVTRSRQLAPQSARAPCVFGIHVRVNVILVLAK